MNFYIKKHNIYIIKQEGVKPNPSKIQAIVDRKLPRNIKKIKSCLGLTGYYRRFIKNYAEIAKPLSRLLKNGVPFEFDDKCQDTFTKLKIALTTEPALQYPNFDEPFILTTEASNEAIRSILSQGPLTKDKQIA